MMYFTPPLNFKGRSRRKGLKGTKGRSRRKGLKDLKGRRQKRGLMDNGREWV